MSAVYEFVPERTLRIGEIALPAGKPICEVLLLVDGLDPGQIIAECHKLHAKPRKKVTRRPAPPAMAADPDHPPDEKGTPECST